MADNITEYRQKFWGNKKDSDYYDDYARISNRRRWLAKILLSYKPRSIAEIGCNVGANLRAIHEIDPTIELAGLDIDPIAIERAAKTLPGKFVAASIYDAAAKMEKKYDVVFTCGVLIHIPPESIARAVEQVQAIGKTVVLLEDHGVPRIRKYESGVPARWVHDYSEYFPQAKILRPVDRYSDGWNHLIVPCTPSIWLFYVRPFLNGAYRKMQRSVGCKYEI